MATDIHSDWSNLRRVLINHPMTNTYIFSIVNPHVALGEITSSLSGTTKYYFPT